MPCYKNDNFLHVWNFSLPPSFYFFYFFSPIAVVLNPGESNQNKCPVFLPHGEQVLITTQEYLCGWFWTWNNSFDSHVLWVYDVSLVIWNLNLWASVFLPLSSYLLSLLPPRENLNHLLPSAKCNEISTASATHCTQGNTSLA